MKTQARQSVASRRAELMAELFLEEFNPLFLSRPVPDVGYDLLVGFTNDKGGVNTFTVEVKSTLKPPGPHFAMPRRSYARLAHSNVPALLLLADVKQNELYFSWLRPVPKVANGSTIAIPLTQVTETTKRALERKFRKAELTIAAAG